MSRFGDGDSDAMPLALFRGNVERALKGKRGQRALREMREALLALPEKALIEGALCDVAYDENDKPVAIGFCAVGAFAFYKRARAGQPVEEALEALASYPEDEDEQGTIEEGRKRGLVYCLAWELAWMNDEGLGQWQHSLTPEERYAKYLAWVESQIVRFV